MSYVWLLCVCMCAWWNKGKSKSSGIDVKCPKWQEPSTSAAASFLISHWENDDGEITDKVKETCQGMEDLVLGILSVVVVAGNVFLSIQFFMLDMTLKGLKKKGSDIRKGQRHTWEVFFLNIIIFLKNGWEIFLMKFNNRIRMTSRRYFKGVERGERLEKVSLVVITAILFVCAL